MPNECIIRIRKLSNENMLFDRIGAYADCEHEQYSSPRKLQTTVSHRNHDLFEIDRLHLRI